MVLDDWCYYQCRCFRSGVVKRALEKVRSQSFDVVAEKLLKRQPSRLLSWSISWPDGWWKTRRWFWDCWFEFGSNSCSRWFCAQVLEEMGLETVGTHGTTAAPAPLNDQVKKRQVMAYSQVGGLTGAHPSFRRWGYDSSSAKWFPKSWKIRSHDCYLFSRVGYDCYSEDTPAKRLRLWLRDEAAIGVGNMKTTAVRIIPKE